MAKKKIQTMADFDSMKKETGIEESATGVRFDEGKARYDLIPYDVLHSVAEVYTYGTRKYIDRNWEKGMKFSQMYASAMRHVTAFWRGEEIDPESGLPHLAHATFNLWGLQEFLKTHPEMDDRPLDWKRDIRWGLDIDGVIANFSQGVIDYAKRIGIKGMISENWEKIHSWRFPNTLEDVWAKVSSDEKFWLNLPAFNNPIPFEPSCYITARPIKSEITRQWIESMGYPTAPIETVSYGESKVTAAKKHKITHFVDDNWDNFITLNKAGITTYLHSRPWNLRFDAGYLRIESLMDLKRSI